jgi:hypothetical protein
LQDSDSKIEAQIAVRNEIRNAAQLPLLDQQEMDRLRSARANRIFEAVFASQRPRFSDMLTGAGGWFSRYGRWAQVRSQVRRELLHGLHLQYVLNELGFRAATDDWDARGQRQYVLADRTSPLVMDDLAAILIEYGWKKLGDQSPTFSNIHTGETLDFSRDSAGILLHHKKGSLR